MAAVVGDGILYVTAKVLGVVSVDRRQLYCAPWGWFFKKRVAELVLCRPDASARRVNCGAVIFADSPTTPITHHQADDDIMYILSR
jgi:hypothetical protein